MDFSALCAGCPHRASLWVMESCLQVSGMKVGVKALARSCHAGKPLPIEGEIGGVDTGGGKALLREGYDKVLYCVTPGDLARGREEGVPSWVAWAAGLGTRELMMVLDDSIAGDTGIEDVLARAGAVAPRVVDPLRVAAAKQALKDALRQDGPAILVFRNPCARSRNVEEGQGVYVAMCSACLKCVKELGCPALAYRFNWPYPPADNPTNERRRDVCRACGLCAAFCPFKAPKLRRAGMKMSNALEGRVCARPLD